MSCVLKNTKRKIDYLKRVLPRTRGETRKAGYELLGSLQYKRAQELLKSRRGYEDAPGKYGWQYGFNKKYADDYLLDSGESYLESGDKDRALRIFREIDMGRLSSVFAPLSDEEPRLDLSKHFKELGAIDDSKKAEKRAYRSLFHRHDIFQTPEKGKKALMYAIKAGMPLEETSKLRKKIQEYKEKARASQERPKEKSRLARILDKVFVVILVVGIIGLIFNSIGAFTGYFVLNTNPSSSYSFPILIAVIILAWAWFWFKRKE